MKGKRLSEEQIIKVLNEFDSSLLVDEVCRTRLAQRSKPEHHCHCLRCPIHRSQLLLTSVQTPLQLHATRVATRGRPIP